MRYFGEFTFDERHGLLWQEGVRIPLTAKAAGVLNCLLASPNRLATKEEILRSVWPDTHVAPDNVKVLIREVRSALRDDAQAPRYIRTIARGTYAFVAPVQNTQPSNGGDRDTPFCGRRAELATLEAAIPPASEHPSLYVITGPTGIGKTTLAERALRAAERNGCLVARGQCIPSSAVPREHYGVLLDTIGRLMIEVPRVREIIQPHAPTVLQQLQHATSFPHIGSGNDVISPPSLLRELIAAFEALARETPVVLALEDVQWLDDADVDVIGALLRRHRPLRLTVMVTSRPLEAYAESGALRRMIAELQIARVAEVLQLAPLSHSEIAQYANKRFGKALGGELYPFLDTVTGGIPLLLRTVGDMLFEKSALRTERGVWAPARSIDDVTRVAYQAISFVLARQLELVTHDDQQLLMAVSHLGLEFSAASASAIAGRDAADVEAQLEQLARQGELMTFAPDKQDLLGGKWFRFTNTAYRDLLAGGPGARLPITLAASNPFLPPRRRRPLTIRSRETFHGSARAASD
jgi:DNA-binding winged helix-turn-helix (wHTH) protein